MFIQLTSPDDTKLSIRISSIEYISEEYSPKLGTKSLIVCNSKAGDCYVKESIHEITKMLDKYNESASAIRLSTDQELVDG